MVDSVHASLTLTQRVGFHGSLAPALAQDREQHAPYSLYVDAVKT